MVFNEQKRANEFFLKELKAEEPSTYLPIFKGRKHALKKRGFVDVAWGKQKYDNSWFTTLQILDPGSAPLSWDPSSPFKQGYDYYVKCGTQKNREGMIEQDDVTSENIDNLLSRFWAVFLRILAVKSSPSLDFAAERCHGCPFTHFL